MAAASVRVENPIVQVLLLCSGALHACSIPAYLSISAPNLEALSGSCLLMPCTFTPDPAAHPFDPTKPVVAIWKKTYPFIHISNILTYLFHYNGVSNNTHHMNTVGDLHQKNCTTLFSNISSAHSDQYFLRIENDQFQATAACDPLKIKVKDSPWNPSVQVSGRLREQESVTITCSAQTPCPRAPPKLLWNLHQHPPNSVGRNSDGTFTTSILQTVTLSDRLDGLRVNCTAVYPVDGGEKRANSSLSLRVEYSPKNTSVQLDGNTSLSVGDSVSLSCSSRASPPVFIFSWFRVTSEGPQKVHEGQLYSFVFNNMTRGQYFCQARNRVGEQNSTVLPLQTEDGSWIGVYTIVKICGIVVLFTALLTIKCLFRTKVTKRHNMQAVDSVCY